MSGHMAVLSLAMAMIVTLGWTADDLADEQQAASAVQNAAEASAENPLAEVATGQRAAPRVKEALTKGQPITITFKYGDEVPNLICNVIDDRPITAATTVGSVLSKAASATTIYRPSDAIISVVRTHAVIDDDLNVNVAEKSLRVEWDLASNRPTENTNYKLQPGDRIVVWQPAPLAGEGFVRLAPKPPQAGVWTPTIPPPPEAEPDRPRSVSYVRGQPGPRYLAPMPAADRYAAAPRPQPAVPQPALKATALPFFGQVAIAPEPTQFREVVEEVSLPNGETHTVRRRAPVETQIYFKMQFIRDPGRNLEAFTALREKGLMVGDTETLKGAIRVLEKNSLIPPIDGETGAGGPIHLGQPFGGGLHSERMNLDEATGKTVPGDVTDLTFEIIPRNIGGQLQLTFNIDHVHNGLPRVADGTTEIGRGQSFIARMKAEPGPAGADAKAEDKPLYVLLTPHIEPAENAQPVRPPAAVYSAPMPAPGPPIAVAMPADPIPASWQPQPPQPQPQPMPVAYSVPFAPFDAPQAAMRPQVAAPGVDIAIARLGEQRQIKYEIDIIEDVSGRMKVFMPPPDQSALQLIDSTSIRAALRVFEEQKLVRTISDPRLVAVAGQPAAMRVGNETPNAEMPFEGLDVEVLGQVLGGGMSIEFKLLRTDEDRKIDAKLATLVAHGQTILARTDWKEVKKAKGDAKPPQAAADKKKPANPVYIVITPELLR